MKPKISKCIACGLKVEWTAWASGPVCYPCYWGAKLLYELGISLIEDIPEASREMLSQLFKNGGYLWPDDLIKAWGKRAFEKCDTNLLRWWSPQGGLGDKGVRDPESPCRDFDPSPLRLGEFPECEGDGHYLCRTCKYLKQTEVVIPERI